MSGFSDKLLLAVKNADSKTALKIADVASEYGEIVVDAVNKCDCDSIYKITHYIAESGVSNKVASELFEALSKHGDDLVKAICKCGDEYTDLIIRCVSHEKFAGDVATHFLKAMSDHSDTMIKAIGRCGADNFDTIADYSKIFGKYGKMAEGIVDICKVKKIVGLDEALALTAKKGDAICFTSSKINNDICIVTVNGVYKFNPTISVPQQLMSKLDSLKVEYKKLADMGVNMENDPRAVDLGKKFTGFYNELLSKDYATNYILDGEIAEEYEKLIRFIDENRKSGNGKVPTINWTGLADDFSFYENRSVINCAEIWGAREMILKGCKFENLNIPTRYLLDGSQYRPCKNCSNTFITILK